MVRLTTDDESNDYEEIGDQLHKKQSYSGFTKACLSLTALLISAYVFGEFVLSIVSSNARTPSGRIDYTRDGLLKVSFDNVRNGTFQPVIKPLQWISTTSSVWDDKGLYLTQGNDSYVVNSVLNDTYSKTLLQGKSFIYTKQNYTVDSVVASPDLSKILIRTKTEKNWRHSTFGTYFVFDNNGFNLVGTEIALAQWSPNSIDVAYVKQNNIFLYSSNTYETIKTVTTDGSSQVFNGKPDWVYEEEVLEGDSALWWSPNGEYFAFFKINETVVQEFSIPYFVQDNQENAAYPEVRKIKYPKSGSPNPAVELNVYNLKKDKISRVALQNDTILLTEVIWVGDKQLLAKYSDRASDALTVILVDAENDAKHTISRVEESEGDWWEISHKTTFVPKNEKKSRSQDGYIDLAPVNGYNHLVYFSSSEDSDGIILTSGEWEVVDGPAAFDSETNDVYFIATKKSSIERHLYYVNIEKPLEVHPVTDVSNIGYFDVSFSGGSRFLLLNYLGPDIPYQKIVDLKSKSHDQTVKGNVIGKTLKLLENNEKLRETLKPYAIPQTSFNELNLGKDSKGKDIIVNSLEILPNDFNAKLKNHYPVFFYTYGGPNSQQVATTFSVGFNQVVASQLNAVVVIVDGRGTGFRGKYFRTLVRDNLGDIEAVDQIAAAKLYRSKS